MGNVINNGFVDNDVVVYERNAFICAAATENGNTAKSLARGPEDDRIGGRRCWDGEEGALEDNKFGIDGNVGAWGGKLGFVVQNSAVRVG